MSSTKGRTILRLRQRRQILSVLGREDSCCCEAPLARKLEALGLATVGACEPSATYRIVGTHRKLNVLERLLWPSDFLVVRLTRAGAQEAAAIQALEDNNA